MFRCDEISVLRNHLQAVRGDKVITLVPTMGHLHAGHLALVDEAKRIGEYTVVSIFVNPTQFVAGEDYAVYPRSLEEDCDILAEKKVDMIFSPAAAEMYPPAVTQQVTVDPGELADHYCGKFRPGHFRGVLTVVSKLFNIMQPDCAIFGEKDYQQLLLVHKLVQELGFPVQIYSVATVREADGLACSSRNILLSDTERNQAAILYQTLKWLAESLTTRGVEQHGALSKMAQERLQKAGFAVEYVAVCDALDLSSPKPQADWVILAAARLGNVRLIDNLMVRCA